MNDPQHEETFADTERKLRETITTLRAQLAEAHTRIEAMESGDWSELKLVRFENGQMDITAGPIPAIAEYLAQMMQDGEGKYFNFMEVSINHNTAGPMTLSLQRKNGKTPNQLREEEQARAEAAEAALQRIADSQPRPRRDGNYEAHDLSALQRIARAHLTKHGSQK